MNKFKEKVCYHQLFKNTLYHHKLFIVPEKLSQVKLRIQMKAQYTVKGALIGLEWCFVVPQQQTSYSQV